MKKNNFTSKFLVVTVILFLFSCTAENETDGQYNLEKQSKVTIAEAQKFVTEYVKADNEQKPLLLSSFSKTNKISANDSQAVSTVVTTNYTPFELSQTIPSSGPVQMTLPYTFGNHHIMDVEWIVKQHILALWHIKSFEEVTFSPDKITKVLHKDTALRGLHLDIIGWTEIKSDSNIYIDPSGKYFLSRVEGTIGVAGYGAIPVDEYCIFSTAI